VRLAGRAFIACKIAPTVSRSSFAGGAAGNVGLASASGAAAIGGGPGRSSGALSVAVALGLRTGVAVGGLAGASWGWAPVAPDASTVSSSSVRFKALSIADIAAETGSGAEFCFAIVSASLYRRRSPSRSTNAPTVSPTSLGRRKRHN
jgi:hypothetical protein